MIDDQFELGGLYHRQVSGLCTLEDAANINTHLTIGMRNVAAIGHQPTNLGKFTSRIYRGDSVAPCQLGQLQTPCVEERIAADKEGVRPLPDKSRKDRIDLAAGAGVKDLDLHSP